MLTKPIRVCEVAEWRLYDIDTFYTADYRDDWTRKPIGCRMVGVDGPELRNKRQKPAALANRAAAMVWLSRFDYCYFQYLKRDKYYGRIIVNWFGENGESYTEWTLDNGLVKPYQGRKKPEWTDEELQDVFTRATAITGEV